jgi:multiple sugar transport system permease protein
VAKRARRNPLSWIFTHPKICGPLFIAPWFIGFLAFTLGPFLASLGLSFVKWSLLGSPRWVGLSNYIKIFTDDERFGWAIRNTFIYVLTSVPLKQILALSIAMLLNQKLRGIWLYRSIFYLPTVTAGVATAILWSQMFGYRMGMLNAGLARFGLDPIPWLTDIQWALPTLIFISLWNVGSIFVIYLAGLQGVPTHLYEAAEVDGATSWQRFWKITLPLITPSIFFNIVMGFIGSFRTFTQAYVMTGGGPADRTLFYVLYLFQKGFQDFRMGYASALAWVLFLIILTMTLFQMWLSRRWVYYEGITP